MPTDDNDKANRRDAENAENDHDRPTAGKGERAKGKGERRWQAGMRAAL